MKAHKNQDISEGYKRYERFRNMSNNKWYLINQYVLYEINIGSRLRNFIGFVRIFPCTPEVPIGWKNYDSSNPSWVSLSRPSLKFSLIVQSYIFPKDSIQNYWNRFRTHGMWINLIGRFRRRKGKNSKAKKCFIKLVLSSWTL